MIHNFQSLLTCDIWIGFNTSLMHILSTSYTYIT